MSRIERSASSVPSLARTATRVAFGLGCASLVLACRTPNQEVIPKQPADQPRASTTTAPQPNIEPETARMVELPAGTFTMGSPDAEIGRFADEGPPLSVHIAAFSTDTTPVTTVAFAARMDEVAKREPRAHFYTERDTPAGWLGRCNLGSERLAHPVNCVDWFAARTYCQLSGGDLPTEAEWEYAARAGTHTAFSWGDAFDDSHAITSVACGKRGCRGSTAPVILSGPRCNAWGLCDMIGQVWEWTRSAYAEPLDAQAHALAADDIPKRPVHRGGAWLNHESFLFRSAMRGLNYPEHGLTGVGFRCVYR